MYPFFHQVYPESYWEPLVVLNNATVQVEEGSRVTIDQAALNIMHPNIAPSDITYIIVQRPQNGFLHIELGQTAPPYSSTAAAAAASASRSEFEDEASLLKPEVGRVSYLNVLQYVMKFYHCHHHHHHPQLVYSLPENVYIYPLSCYCFICY